MKKKIILLIVIATIIITILFIYINNKNKVSNSTTKVDTITYNEDDYNYDFSKYKEVKVNLNDVKDVYTITSAGVYHLTGTLNGYVKVSTNDNVKIILDNATITNNGPAIYIENAKNTYIELINNNTLSDSATYSGFTEEVNAVIYSKDDLIMEGTGTLNINSNYEDGIASKDDLVIKSGTYNIKSTDDGIRGKDSVIILDGNFNITSGGDAIKTTNETDTNKGNILIEGGTYTITSTNDAIDSINNIEINNGEFNLTTGGGSTNSSTTNNNWGTWNNNNKSNTKSAKGIKAVNNILINNINLNADTSDDAIHSNNIVEINDGSITISSGDDGIHADSVITINNGSIDIKKSYEGIEANTININDGNIKIVADDDGININGGNDGSSMGRPGENTSSSSNKDIKLVINGGEIYVNSTGDGLDSNGSIYINGGYITVDGPTDNGNGSLDYNNTLEITGGTLIAAGSSGMMQNATSSTNGTILIYFDTTQTGGTEVSIDDIIKYTPSKNYNCILISSPSIKTGTTYNVKLNNSNYTTFTLDNTIGSIGSNNRGNMQNRGGRR